MARDNSGDQFADIARSMSIPHGELATIDIATATAVKIIDGCEHAGVSLVRNRAEVETHTATDELVARAHQLENELGEGPCLQSVEQEETVQVDDLRSEVRWPQWSQRAAEQLGIRSVLSLQLFVGPKTFGSLDLYSTSPDAFRLEDRVSALSLAAHVAVALVGAHERETMESALITRTTIGQAEGMLMQYLGIKADQAFSTLVRLSQTRNIKLHQVAADIVTHGIRPELFA